MPHAAQDLAALRLRASARGGVVAVEDLRACGFSAAAVRRRCACGDWSRLGRAVVLAPAGGHHDDVAWSWILRITYGEHSRISGHLAMRHAGWSLPLETRIVVMPHQPKTHIDGVRVLRRADGGAVMRRDGVRFTPAREALLDALVVLGPPRSEALLDAALQRRLVTPSDLAHAISPRLGNGQRGAADLRALLNRALSGSRSEAEQRMGALLKRSGTGPWLANHPVRDESGRVVAEIDFAHEGLRIAIEVDGRAHHTDRRSFEHDRVRQNALVVRGWLVLRFTWEQITQRPDEVIAAVCAAVLQRAA